MNGPTLRLWSQVLSNVPDSRLLLLVDSERQRRPSGHRSRSRDRSGPDRVPGQRRRGEYLRLYDRIDICLDPLPYGGVTTTCDALWMGVPVISRVGDTAAGRAGLSILSNVQMPELPPGMTSVLLRSRRDWRRIMAGEANCAERCAIGCGLAADGRPAVRERHGGGISADVAAMAGVFSPFDAWPPRLHFAPSARKRL